jgi:3-oxoacyl-[acyl-carrier-protein] synthase-3
MTRARIRGVGRYVPERVLSNQELEHTVNTSDQWIQERTGIQERRIAADLETTSTMAIRAAQAALESAELDASEIDLVIVATSTPDGMFPAAASRVQSGIGASRAGAFDVNAACAGFMAGIATGSQFIAGGGAQRVLVVGSEVMSRIVDWSDRSTCVLFGDGAGAVVLEADETGAGVLSFRLRSDGNGAGLLYVGGPAGPKSKENRDYYIKMNGPQVFRFAVTALEEVVREVLGAAGLDVCDIDLLVPHQANLRIISAAAKSMRLPMDRIVTNVAHYGNTSSASVPIALSEAVEAGRLSEGDRVVLVAFGGGLVWGAMALEWTPLGSRRPSLRRPPASLPVAGTVP